LLKEEFEMKRSILSLALVAAVSTSAMASDFGEVTGTVIGGIVGGVVGSKLGGGNQFGIIAGSAIGAGIGRSIGSSPTNPGGYQTIPAPPTVNNYPAPVYQGQPQVIYQQAPQVVYQQPQPISDGCMNDGYFKGEYNPAAARAYCRGAYEALRRNQARAERDAWIEGHRAFEQAERDSYRWGASGRY